MAAGAGGAGRKVAVAAVQFACTDTASDNVATAESTTSVPEYSSRPFFCKTAPALFHLNGNVPDVSEQSRGNLRRWLRPRRPRRRILLEGAAEEGEAAVCVVGEGPGGGGLAELLDEREHELEPAEEVEAVLSRRAAELVEGARGGSSSSGSLFSDAPAPSSPTLRLPLLRRFGSLLRNLQGRDPLFLKDWDLDFLLPGGVRHLLLPAADALRELLFVEDFEAAQLRHLLVPALLISSCVGQGFQHRDICQHSSFKGSCPTTATTAR